MSDARIQSIDTLRAIAVIIVFIVHTWPSGQPEADALYNSLYHFIKVHILFQGHLGVMLFFIISGYVIPFSLINHRNNHILKFVLSRFLRLYPAYWLSIIFALIVMVKPIDIGVTVINLTMVQKLFFVPNLLSVYWSLFIELIFYGLTALLFMAGLLSSARHVTLVTISIVLLTLLAATLRYFEIFDLPVGTMMFLCVMYLGSWLRLGISSRTSLYVAIPAFLLVMAACSLLMNNPHYGSFWDGQFGKFFCSVLIFLFLLYAKDINIPLPHAHKHDNI